MKLLKVKIALLLGLTVSLAYIYFYHDLGEQLTFENVEVLISGSLDKTFIFVSVTSIILIGCSVFVSVPLMVFALSLILDTPYSFILSIVLLSIGSIVPYAVGASFDYNFIKDRFKEKSELLRRIISKKGLLGVVLIRISPIPPYTATSLILGSLKIPFLKYLLGTSIGLIPITLLTLLFGRGAKELISNKIISFKILIISALAIIAVFYIYAYFKMKKER